MWAATRRCLVLCMGMAGMSLLGTAVGQAANAPDDPLPPQGAAWKYATLAVPTRLSPVSDSLQGLLNKGYQIVTNSPYPEGFLMTLRGTRAHADNQILCVLQPPRIGTDQKVPVSRCWTLNQPTA